MIRNQLLHIRHHVQSASGAGNNWLGLTNGVGSKYQAPGISQSVDTITGAQYTFSLDYAGQLGLSSANTQIGVYLDGQLLGNYSNASVGSLNWQALNFSFKGDGAAHTLKGKRGRYPFGGKKRIAMWQCKFC